MSDYFFNNEETILIKNEKKKKPHDLLDKYGSVEEIEKNAFGVDEYEYMFANTNNLIDEVLEERRSEQYSLSNDTHQKRNKLLSDNDDFLLDGLTLSERQRKAINKLDMVNQLTIIRALREKQGLKNSNYGEKYANNDKNSMIDGDSSSELGHLSAKYESNHNPQVKGYDKNGGYSYGLYQIETRHGTMLDYLKYLKSKPHYRDFANTLINAGGYAGAYNKTDDFVDAWNKLSANKDFNASQYQFILDKKLTPVLRGVKKIRGFDVENRNPVIKQMLYSLATQHGEGNALELIRNAIGNNAEGLNDEDLINRIYDERSDVNRYFANSTKSVRESIKKNRLPRERRDILRALRK